MRNEHAVFPMPMLSVQCGLARGWGPGRADWEMSPLPHTHTCALPEHTHLHAPTHYTQADTTHAHTSNVRILSPYTTRTHPGRHAQNHTTGPCRPTQHPCARYQKCPLVPQGGPVKWGHPDTPGHSEEDPQAPPARSPAPAAALLPIVKHTHTATGPRDHDWPPPALDPGPWLFRAFPGLGK